MANSDTSYQHCTKTYLVVRGARDDLRGHYSDGEHASTGEPPRLPHSYHPYALQQQWHLHTIPSPFQYRTVLPWLDLHVSPIIPRVPVPRGLPWSKNFYKTLSSNNEYTPIHTIDSCQTIPYSEPQSSPSQLCHYLNVCKVDAQ